MLKLLAELVVAAVDLDAQVGLAQLGGHPRALGRQLGSTESTWHCRPGGADQVHLERMQEQPGRADRDPRARELDLVY